MQGVMMAISSRATDAIVHVVLNWDGTVPEEQLVKRIHVRPFVEMGTTLSAMKRAMTATLAARMDARQTAR